MVCPSRTQHAPGCRPGRPRCKWHRKVNPKWKTCNCGNMHFPHRRGSGLCELSPNQKAREEALYGPEPDNAPTSDPIPF